MNPLADLSNALRGWGEILAGRPTGTGRFRTDAAGIGSAAIALGVALLLSIAAQSALAGTPQIASVVFGIIVQSITVALLIAVITQTVRWRRLDVRPAALLVPGLYALAFVFFLAIVLTFISPEATLLAVATLGLLMFRLGQLAGGMKSLAALGFALACVIVLVVVPNALYILLSFLPSA